MKKVLAFAREAGGVTAIAPVCHAMINEGWNVVILSKDHGLNAFRERGLDCVDFPKYDEDALGVLLERCSGSMPDMIFTSATSLPTLDMSEKYLWRWGARKGIPTIGVLDQWQNYALRFSGASVEEQLAYMPDHIFVMDEYAKEQMVREGIPSNRIVVTGQPAFDNLIEHFSEHAGKRNEMRRSLGIPDACTVVTFAAEALRKDFGAGLGYDEQSVLAFLGDTLEEISASNPDVKLYFLIKLHPENSPEEFSWTFSKWPALRKSLLGKEVTAIEALAVSDILAGMTSIMLVEAALCGIPVVSLQFNATANSQFMLTERGIIPCASTPEAGSELIRKLLASSAYRAEYLERQKTMRVEGNAVKKTMETLNIILNGRMKP